MKNILASNWHPTRIFRVLVGSIAFVYAIIRQDNLLGLAGGFLLFMGITNTGCCGTTGCNIPVKRSSGDRKKQETGFEEVN